MPVDKRLPQVQRSKPRGIGGWLIFPMLITLTNPLLVLKDLVQMLVPLDIRDMTSGDRILLISTIIFMLFLMIAWIVAAILLFKHKRSFPIFSSRSF